MGADIASANYQQEPIDLKGRLYTSFKTYSKMPPEFDGVYSYTDTADTGSDYLCSIIWGVYMKEAYVLDVYYTQAGMEITEPETAKRLHEHDVNRARIESNNGGSGFARNVVRILKDKYDSNKTVVKWFHQSKNKKARIISNSGWVMDFELSAIRNRIWLKVNAFDNRFIATLSSMAEQGGSQITTTQPAIPHDSYLASYITALDLCLQGIISPSTLGIDVKKLDNAEAQREKEKTTLYTRNAVIEALGQSIPQIISAALNAYNMLHGKQVSAYQISVPFGEYANPSFESQVETVSKAKQGGIMSIEASVDELYGDSKDSDWKAAEVKRLKEEQGVAEVEEPVIAVGE